MNTWGELENLAIAIPNALNANAEGDTVIVTMMDRLTTTPIIRMITTTTLNLSYKGHRNSA